MTPYIVVWAAMAVAILALAAWRQVIDLHEDDSIHLHEGDAGLIKDQVSMGRKISSIDKVGKALTIAAALYGLALCAWVIYGQWVSSTKIL